MEKLIDIENRLKKASRELKDLKKEQRSASFKYLSQYSKKLHETRIADATGVQINIIFELTQLIFSGEVTQKKAEAIVKRATK